MQDKMNGVSNSTLATLLLLLLALVASTSIASGAQLANERQQEEPEGLAAPEPYAFSYNAESQGAMSSHQESGDGRGHVQGFYTILGEDGRERRVDYVADENGFRATVNTNEIGTRAESAADAQFKVSPPSPGQLAQAKASAQEYQLLEEAHANERQRHLNRPTSNRQQQQQQSSFASQWQQSGARNSARWASQDNLATLQRNSSNTEDDSNQSNAAQQQQQQRQQQRQPEFLPVVVSTGRPALVAQSSSTEFSTIQSVGLARQQQQQQQQQQQPAQVDQQAQLAANQQQVFGSNVQFARNLEPTVKRQQAAWQMSSSSGLLPARPQVAVMQRQLEQQFMQQALQLTNQDYPRQPSPPQWMSQATRLLEAQPQQTPDAKDQVDFSQLGQQQNNVIDEISNEQVEPLRSFVNSGQQQRGDQLPVNTTSAFTITADVVNPNGFARLSQMDSRQQTAPITSTVRPVVYQTTAAAGPRTTPGNFLAIELQMNQELSSQANRRQLNQEVGQNSAARLVANQLAQLDQSRQTADYQRASYNQQQQQQQPEFKPNSIKQVIESQQFEGQQRPLTTTSAPALRPETTPIVPTTTTGFLQLNATREPEVESATEKQHSDEEQLSSTARPTASEFASLSYESAGGGSTEGYQEAANQTEAQLAELQFTTSTTSTTRRPIQQNIEVARKQNSSFQQQQRAPIKSGVKGGGLAVEQQRPSSGFSAFQVAQPARDAVSQQLYSATSSNSSSASTAAAQKQQQQQELPRIPSPAYQRQPEVTSTTGGKQKAPATSGGRIEFSARPSFVAPDRNGQLIQQQWSVSNGGVKGGAKVAARREQPFWQPKQWTNSQIDYATGNSSLTSKQMNFGSRLAAAAAR